MTNNQLIPLCPSSRANSPASKVFGIVNGTVEKPHVSYLKEQQPLDDELLSLTESVTPTEVFRIAAPCWENNCQHFDGQNCQLATRIVDNLPEVTEILPPCSIRRDCRWWKQEGKAACARCPQIVTDNFNPSDSVIKISSPITK